ncbi:MAG: T9SS type A sorting domain-containing protein [Bacteroidetes bacterium]|nr:T9SS type A sorting domain-containing protein [Bacteroidota bacterium]
MLKKILILILLAITCNVSVAQTYYYWYKNQKIELEKITNLKYLVVENISDTEELKLKLDIPLAHGSEIQSFNVFFGLNPYQGIIPYELDFVILKQENIDTISFTAHQDVLYEASFFKYQNYENGLSHLMYVKLEQAADTNLLDSMAIQNGVKILGNNKLMPLWYTLSCNKFSNGNTMEMANLFYESGLFEAAEPELFLYQGTLSSPSSMEAPVKESIVELFPNPMQGGSSINYKIKDENLNPAEEQLIFYLYDLYGKTISTNRITNLSGSIELTGYALPNGIYFYRFINGQNNSIDSGKLLIAK